MRRVVWVAFCALLFGSQASAADFIVVSSNDPSLKTGQSLDAGARLALGAGHALTLMRPSGEVIILQGAAAGVTLPGASAQAETVKFAGVQALFVRPPSGRTFGARRGFCPGPEVLDNIGAIVRSYEAGCKADARAAFQGYLKGHGVGAEDADHLYVNTVLDDVQAQPAR